MSKLIDTVGDLIDELEKRGRHRKVRAMPGGPFSGMPLGVVESAFGGTDGDVFVGPSISREARQIRDEEAAVVRAEEQRVRQAKLTAEIMRGSPGRSTPSSVLRSSDFEKVSETMRASYPSSVHLVVRHVGRGTLWACQYALGNDSSDVDVETSWWEVEAETKTVVEYVRKGG